MSEYRRGNFLGFSACVPKWMIINWFYFSLLCPSVPVNSGGSVKYAPCGTRKIEPALQEYGFKRKDVIVVHPEHLHQVVEPRTKAVGITENDPLGMDPTTYDPLPMPTRKQIMAYMFLPEFAFQRFLLSLYYQLEEVV